MIWSSIPLQKTEDGSVSNKPYYGKSIYWVGGDGIIEFIVISFVFFLLPSFLKCCQCLIIPVIGSIKFLYLCLLVINFAKVDLTPLTVFLVMNIGT